MPQLVPYLARLSLHPTWLCSIDIYSRVPRLHLPVVTLPDILWSVSEYDPLHPLVTSDRTPPTLEGSTFHEAKGSQRQSQLINCLLSLTDSTSLQYALIKRHSLIIHAKPCSVREEGVCHSCTRSFGWALYIRQALLCRYAQSCATAVSSSSKLCDYNTHPRSCVAHGVYCPAACGSFLVHVVEMILSASIVDS